MTPGTLPGFPARRLLSLLLRALVVLALLTGIAGGLLRVGVAVMSPDHAWIGQAALSHAALMIGAFMGTVVGIERAVAVKVRWAWLAPLAAGASGPLLLLGERVAAGWVLCAAGVAFVVVNVLVIHRQRASHTVLLLAGAAVWLAGNLLFAAGVASQAVLSLWFAFLVITIAAERLEMTRLMRRRPGAQASLNLLLGALVLAALLSALSPGWGGVFYGVVLVLLAAWLLVFDIARRTILAGGLPRYMAACLIGGYAWLAVSGIAWAAAAMGAPSRDLALHAIGLGFIVSMMMGHAPVILPAVARVKLLFGNWFYLPLAALHLSLVVRFVPGWNDLAWRGQGAVLNAAAIGLFAATVLATALAWRRAHPIRHHHRHP